MSEDTENLELWIERRFDELYEKIESLERLLLMHVKDIKNDIIDLERKAHEH